MRKTGSVLMAALLLSIWTAGCGQADPAQATESDNPQKEIVTDSSDVIRLDSEIIELENGFEAVKFEGNDGFEEFLSQGGAASDSEVVRFLTENLIAGTELDFMEDFFGCSTIVPCSSNACIKISYLSWDCAVPMPFFSPSAK